MSEAATPGVIPVDTQHGDDVDVRAIVVWGLVSVLITIASIAGLYALYTTFYDEQRVIKSYDQKFVVADNAISQQVESLEGNIRYLSTDGKTIGVPIGKAMEIVAKEFEQKQ